jgi:uncharacterized protein with GYD domain
MCKYMIKFDYSTGSWARMAKVTDDRTAAVSALLESLGGSLEALYWDAQSCAAYALADLPDAVSAAAAVTAAARTGAFVGVEAHRLLTEHQMHDALALARMAGNAYHAPGSAAIESALGRDMVSSDGHCPAGAPGTW